MEINYSKVINFLKSLSELAPFFSINYYQEDDYLWIDSAPPYLGALMTLLWSTTDDYRFCFEDGKIKVLINN